MESAIGLESTSLLTAMISTFNSASRGEVTGENEPTEQSDKAEASPWVTAIVGDDHEAARSRIREILEEMGIRVVAEFSNGELLLDAVLRLRPQLVTVDIRMPGMNGLVATEHIKHDCPQTRVFVVTNYPNEQYRRAAEKMGADAFLAKSDAYAGLQQAIKQWFGLRSEASEDSAQAQ
jgi:DNA-binding NarL/FixJ family response regulator